MTLFFIVITGALLRLYRLGVFSLWFDEADSVLSAIHPLQTLEMLKAGRVLVMHNLFLNFWKIVGVDEFRLRFSSVIFGVLAIVVLYLLAKHVFDKKTALWSAFFLSISPFNIYYSQELRPYAMMVLLTICTVYCFIKGWEEKKILYWLGYVVFAVLNFYTHWIAAFYFFTLIVYSVLRYRRDSGARKMFFISNIIIAVLSVPWAWSLVRVSRLVFDRDSLFSQISIGWIPPVNYTSILWTLKNFTAGYSVGHFVAAMILSLYGLFFFRGIFCSRDKQKVLLPLLLFIFPVILLFGISKYRSFYIDRYLIASCPFFYLIVACGLKETKKIFRLSALGAFTVFSAYALTMQYDNFLAGSFIEHRGVQCKKQERQAAEYILGNLGVEDGIFHVCRSTVLPFEFYFKYAGWPKISSDKREYPQLLVFLKEEDGSSADLELCRYSLVTGELDDRYVYRPVDVTVKDFGRIWLIFSEWDFVLASKPDSLENKMLEILKKNYRIEDLKQFSGVNVYLFIKK
ncbi:MAG: glycosyltransferase family 39 protein [Bacteroidales bacterium]